MADLYKGVSSSGSVLLSRGRRPWSRGDFTSNLPSGSKSATSQSPAKYTTSRTPGRLRWTGLCKPLPSPSILHALAGPVLSTRAATRDLRGLAKASHAWTCTRLKSGGGPALKHEATARQWQSQSFRLVQVALPALTALSAPARAPRLAEAAARSAQPCCAPRSDTEDSLRRRSP